MLVERGPQPGASWLELRRPRQAGKQASSRADLALPRGRRNVGNDFRRCSRCLLLPWSSPLPSDRHLASHHGFHRPLDAAAAAGSWHQPHCHTPKHSIDWSKCPHHRRLFLARTARRNSRYPPFRDIQGVTLCRVIQYTSAPRG